MIRINTLSTCIYICTTHSPSTQRQRRTHKCSRFERYCHIVQSGQVHYLDQHLVYTITPYNSPHMTFRVRVRSPSTGLDNAPDSSLYPLQLSSVMGLSHTLTPKLAILRLCASLVGTQIAIVINIFLANQRSPTAQSYSEKRYVYINVWNIPCRTQWLKTEGVEQDGSYWLGVR